MFDKLKLRLRALNDCRLGKKHDKASKKLKKLKPKHVAWFGKDGKPMYRTRAPIYKLGSPDPVSFVSGNTDNINHPNICWIPNMQNSEFTRGYNSFSGIDIKICFDEKAIGTVQGFSFHRHINEGKVCIEGSACFLMFDQHHDFIGKTVTMTAVAANEYGALSCLFSEKIRFNSQSYGIAVDDIVSEEWYTFEGVTEETVEQHQERISKTTGVIEPKEKSNETS